MENYKIYPVAIFNTNNRRKMIYYLLAASILSLLLVCFFYLRKVKVKKEIDYFIVFFPTVLSLGIIVYEFSIVEPIDARYVDKRVRELRHYSSWSEVVLELDSTTGKMRDNEIIHNDYYSFTYLNDNGVQEERDLSKETYDYFSKTWGDKPSFTYSDSLKRVINIYRWNNKKGKRPILTYTMTEPYINYFKNTMDLYDFNSVSEKDIIRLGLYEKYNNVTTINSDDIVEPRQSLVYGIELDDSVDRSLNYLASMSSSFRPLLLVWVGCDKYSLKEKIIKGQRSCWKGGKDNEAVFCICINNKEDRRIVWSGSFSWAEDKRLEDYVLTFALSPGNKLDLDKYMNTVIEGYGKNLWKPRDFSKYYFCKMPLKDFKIVFLMFSLIIINVIISIKIIKRNNGYRKENL